MSRMQATRTGRLKTVILLLAVAGLTSGLAVWFAGRPEIADMIWIAGVAPALAALVVEILRSLRSGEVGLDIVAALSMSAALVFGETLAAAVVAVMYSGGTFLEAFAEGRARREMHDLLSRVPRTATRHRNGGLFDETGDRLTPSHSKTKKGTRLRYYISHRLVARSGEAHPGAWHLPADDLETRIADLGRTTISRNGFIASVMQGESADAIARALAAAAAWLANARPEDLLRLVARVDIEPGAMTLKMDAVILTEPIAIDAEYINADALTSRHPFQLRKRGVETRIVLADTPTGQDETLIRNIARANAWFGRIKSGETFAEIAETEGTSKRRVQQMIDLAFLAPDIVRDVLDGKQPMGFTSEWFLRHDLPSDWQEQHALVATL
jgi:hypothetical protein